MTEILSVDHLSIGFDQHGLTSFIDDVNFKIEKGQTVCIVGESGCGKSITSLAVMGLLPNGGRINEGNIIFNNQDLYKKSQKEWSKIRGNEISIIFQEPMTALNPLHTIGHQIAEVLCIHEKISRHKAKEKTIDMLNLVGISSPEKRFGQYPHELSGGMRQRVMIAMALICHPDLLVADEPTTALDVTIQAQILDLIQTLKQKFDMSLLLITHDLGVVSETADKVIVMYAGQIVEYGDAEEIFTVPKHPYTKGLISSIPSMEQSPDILPTIKGTVPSQDEMPSGCRFVDRCPFAKAICSQRKPPKFIADHEVHCWIYGQEEQKEGKSLA